MPGHKGRAPFACGDLYALDTTELPDTDDLWQPGPAIREAEASFAACAGAAETLFLTGGSTAGVHAMLQLWAREGDTVILPRNAHLSAVNACILGGLEIAWIPPSSAADGYLYTSEEAVLETLTRHPEARTLLLTRPDYMGGCIALNRIVGMAHGLGVRVAVDEAHGAHLPWSRSISSASDAGADAWVQSTHKTLPALTGTAVLHLRNAADRPRAMRLLRRELSSSPSYLLVRSIDDARAWMEEHGARRLRDVTAGADRLRAMLSSAGYADARDAWGDTGYAFDPTRLVIRAPQGGEALAERLRERCIDAEMAYGPWTVMILSAATAEADLDALAKALAEIRPEGRAPAEPPLPLALPRRRMSVRAAAMAESEPVPLDRAAGRVAAESAGLYPPGIPLVVPGEEITGAVTAVLSAAQPDRRFGVEGECILCAV
ncbi:MAG: aminotransferase class I/II-fold pyridoxal phosphate-dependent enzyme [Clostridia bacterium]|nr:aminotransferase class I/II-fold pyridoxal phosphate-dependent enzyme [Clostridia bacterium]